MMFSIVAGATVALLSSAYLTHSLFRIFLPSRGIAGWRLRDTLGAAMLLLMGSALVGGACVLMPLFWQMALALLPPAALLMRLGVNSLRKLV